MAANRFATMLSRNTNKITVILVYAVLEWLLMFFLFVHSLFTYFLVKFTSYFGLKQPCLFCSRLDRFFERSPDTEISYKDLICENHAAELSGLSFCKNHRKLAESTRICSDRSIREEDNFWKRSIGFSFCPCCHKSSEEKPYPNYLLLKSSPWGHSLGYKENGGLILEMIDDDKIGDGFERERESDRSVGKGQEQNNGEVISDVESCGLISLREVSEEDGLRSTSTNCLGNEEEISEIQHFSGPLCFAKDDDDDDDDNDDSVKIMDPCYHAINACESSRLIPVDVIDSSTLINLRIISSNEEGQAPEAEQKGDKEGAKRVFCKPEDEGKKSEEEEEEDDRVEEKLPETPTWGDTLKLGLLDGNREPSGEGSVEESVVSEMDGGDPFQTIERLRTAVRSEREALRVLYAELEEERSASAISANQTMAMITRLQEEKAKVQMEALQYQRMMEEQAEYDQEALQLLNDLMVKREKEKELLQKEVEVYRKKILEYESKEKKNRIQSEYKSDDDEESVHDDDDDEQRDDDNDDDDEMDLEKITMDCVKHMGMLDESLSGFEEERLAIMDQLKALEEKLLTMQEDESAEASNITGEIITKSYAANCEGSNEETFSERLTMASMAKSLLPLLDAAEREEDYEEGFQEESESMERNINIDGEKLEIIKQVDDVYDRLHALETDGEFLKNCMASVKKGDKGMNLLQEILQHLRDLRNIQLCET